MKTFSEFLSEGKTLTLYHGSHVPIKKFNNKFSAQGVFWFADNKEIILGGSSGAVSSKYLMTCKVKVSKTAGWDEYEPLSLAEIEQKGFDSIHLDENWIIFDAKNIKVIKTEERK